MTATSAASAGVAPIRITSLTASQPAAPTTAPTAITHAAERPRSASVARGVSGATSDVVRASATSPGYTGPSRRIHSSRSMHRILY